MAKPITGYFCPECGHTKLRFETQKKADNFIKFNAEEILEENGKAPDRSYYCPLCCAWHVTSNPNKEACESSAKIKVKLLDKRIEAQKIKKENSKFQNLGKKLFAQEFLKLEELFGMGNLGEANDLVELIELQLTHYKCKKRVFFVKKLEELKRYLANKNAEKFVLLPMDSPQFKNDVMVIIDNFKVVYESISDCSWKIAMSLLNENNVLLNNLKQQCCDVSKLMPYQTKYLKILESEEVKFELLPMNTSFFKPLVMKVIGNLEVISQHIENNEPDAAEVLLEENEGIMNKLRNRSCDVSALEGFQEERWNKVYDISKD